jgi:hypothetical protein
VAADLRLLLGKEAGARISPENSCGERTSTMVVEPMEATTSSRKARMEGSAS